MKQVRRTLIGGQQGTGKSTLCRMLMNSQPLNDHLTIEPDEYGDGWAPFGYELIEPTPEKLRTLTGKNRIVWNKSNKTILDDIFTNTFNTAICFDDIYFLLQSNNTVRDLERILGRARQTGNQIFVTIHGFSLVPAALWTYFTDVVIMKTGDEPDRSAYKIPGFEKMATAIEIVNQNPSPRALIHIKKTL